jgi:hypothetical protein
MLEILSYTHLRAASSVQCPRTVAETDKMIQKALLRINKEIDANDV